MKKVIVIGCPGSGKSTFARKLAQFTGIPLFYLDMMYWNSDRTTVGKEVFLHRLNEAMANPHWIIDGNYASTMEMRFKECDTVFFLDYPTEVCLRGVEERRGKPREDMPWVESGTDEEFIAFINSYNSESRPKVIKLIENNPDKKVVVFYTREESDEFLKGIIK